MGLLVEGQWQDKWYDSAASGERFQRSASVFRNWITPDGSAGPEGHGSFRAEAGRYHLYVSLAWPWAHRTLLMRQLKKLFQLIPVSVVHPLMLENGWTFSRDFPGATCDPLFDKAFLYQLYLQADPGYSGRVTVPVLWDKQQQTIVSNESADIQRMFNSEFDSAGALAGDYYPPDLRAAIDEVNGWVYPRLIMGVYKAGIAI